MDWLQWTAWNVYEGSDDELKTTINEVFKSLKDNGDGTVKLHKFIKVMKEMNLLRMANQHVCEQLKQKGKDGLEYADVVTLFYAVGSGRPICDGCGDLVVGLYLTCSKCYNKPGESTFNLCDYCYRKNLYSHTHNEFVDNFRMLQTKRSEFLKIQSVINDATSTNKQKNPVPRNRALLKNYCGLANYLIGKNPLHI